ncbi:hypothetical protein AHAS_Ahas13G0296200 [Arachis hypogaea]
MEFNSSYDQTNSMGYHPPSPISNGGWEYHQQITNPEHSNSWRLASETQDEKENHMGYFPPPQNDASHDSNGGWEGNSSAPYDNHPKISSLDHTSTESPSQNSPPTQTSLNHSRLSELESKLEKYAKEAQISEKRQEAFFKNMNEEVEKIRRSLEPLSKKNEGQLMDMKEKVEEQDKEATTSSELSMKNEVVEPETALEMTREHENSQLSQTSLDQNASTSESMIERYDEEMKKCWEDRQTSPMIERLKQMLGVKEEVEEQESEEVIPNSSEAKKYMKEEFTEPPLQETLDEDKTPTITQPPKHGFKEVKAINKSTKKRIVTKLPRTTFKRRSTTSNPTPGPIASKLNQAMYKRKLAEERPRQGVIAESSPPLKSFLLTNWKKRKKVKNSLLQIFTGYLH